MVKPFQFDIKLHVNGIVHLINAQHMEKLNSYIDFNRACFTISVVHHLEWWDIFVVPLIQYYQLAAFFIRAIFTVWDLVASLSHSNALSVIACELLTA